LVTVEVASKPKSTKSRILPFVDFDFDATVYRRKLTPHFYEPKYVINELRRKIITVNWQHL